MLRTAVIVLSAAASVLALGGAGAAKPAPEWTLTDIGTPPGQPGAFMNAVAVNGANEILGDALIGSMGQSQIAFTWLNGHFTMLAYHRTKWIDVVALNDRGYVVGEANGAPGGAVIWKAGKPITLGTLGGKSTSATALDDRGQVVGSSLTADGQMHAFLWQNGKMTDLGTLGGTSSEATAINARGQITGTSTTPDGMTHAFLWQNGRMTDLGSLRGVDSYPTAINDKGDVVGYTTSHDISGNPIDAILWKAGKLTDLGRFGAPGATAAAINDRGHILVRLDSRSGDPSAALLLEGAKQLGIRSLGGSTEPGQGGPLIALRLSESDQVIGYGYTNANRRRTFIWRNGTTTLLPTTDGAGPPWGGPAALNDNSVAIGIGYVSHGGKNYQHILLWRPAR